MSWAIVVDHGDGRAVIGPYPDTPKGRALFNEHVDGLRQRIADDDEGTVHHVVSQVRLTPVRDWDIIL